MSNDLMIPDAASVPAYLRNPELARKANEEAASGISTGFPARIKLSGKQFTLVDGTGEETPFPPAKLVAGPDGNTYLPILVLRAKRALRKAWYALAYNPTADAGVAPDCFSEDSERPDAASAAPQCETCAACPHNAFGSGKDQNGNATGGKACADTKILAVFVPGFGVHMLKIPPASLKNFGLYVKQLSANGIPLGTVKTLVGFDLAETYPIMVFKYGGFLPENMMPKLIELSESLEVSEIVDTKPSSGTTTPRQVAASAEETKTTPQPAAETRDHIEVHQPGMADDFNLDLPGVGGDAGSATTAKKGGRGKGKAAAATQTAPPVEANQAQSGAAVSDEELMKELGL